MHRSEEVQAEFGARLRELTGPETLALMLSVMKRSPTANLVDIAELALQLGVACGALAQEDVTRARNEGWFNPGRYPCDAVGRLLMDWCAPGRGFPEFQHYHVLVAIHLTEIGRASLLETLDHPLSDAYGGGLQDLPEIARARLGDAAKCYRHGLFRAALVMAGVAYEQIVTVVAASLRPELSDRSYTEQLGALALHFAGLAADPKRKGPKQPVHEAVLAITSARICADQRNIGGHPDATEPRAVDAEELLMKAPHWMRKLLHAPLA